MSFLWLEEINSLKDIIYPPLVQTVSTSLKSRLVKLVKFLDFFQKSCFSIQKRFTNKGGGEFWFRVDVGNRFYQHDLSSNEYPAEDLQNHQSLRVKKIILHPKYNGVEHDLALIQLYPSSESGECAVFSDQIQPTCINQEHHRFKEWSQNENKNYYYKELKLSHLVKIKHSLRLL